MRAIRNIIITAAFALMLAVIMPVSALAESSGTVIYKNDFSLSGPDETMSYIPSGTASVVKDGTNPVLRCTARADGNRSFKMNFGPQEAKNVDLEFKIRLLGNTSPSSNRVAVFFRSPTIPAFDMLSYQLRFFNAKINLTFADSYAADATTVTVTENLEQGLKVGLWYNVKLCLRDTRISAFVNGTQVIDCMDEKYPALGGFGFTSYGLSFDVDDIVMTGYSGKTLPAPTPNEAAEWSGDLMDAEEADFPDSGEERLNILGLGGGKDGDADTDVADPDELTVNSYIAIGLIAALIIMAVSTLIVSLKLIKTAKSEKQNPSLPSDKPQTGSNIQESSNND